MFPGVPYECYLTLRGLHPDTGDKFESARTETLRDTTVEKAGMFRFLVAYTLLPALLYHLGSFLSSTLSLSLLICMEYKKAPVFLF